MSRTTGAAAGEGRDGWAAGDRAAVGPTHGASEEARAGDSSPMTAERSPAPPRGQGPLAWLRWVTMQQWLAIDAEYRERETRTEGRAVALLLLVALLLTLQKYFGNRGVFTDLFGDVIRGWPYPKIWPHLYWSLACSTVYFVFPALFVRFVLRERVRDYGFRLRGTLRHSPIYLAMFLVVIPLVVIASSTPSFLNKYPFYSQAGSSWTELLVWETAYGIQFISLEFFFRGFMLFYLARHIGAYAVFVMVIPYTMIHYSKPMPETLGAIITGTALGTLALRTRSIFGGVGIHVAVAWSMDLLALYWEGQLGKLLR